MAATGEGMDMTSERDIVHDNGATWVLRTRSGYAVMVPGPTHSTSRATFSKDSDGLSLAVAYADYLARRLAKAA
mgnify:CR=1 FL=1